MQPWALCGRTVLQRLRHLATNTSALQNTPYRLKLGTPWGFREAQHAEAPTEAMVQPPPPATARTPASRV